MQHDDWPTAKLWLNDVCSWPYQKKRVPEQRNEMVWWMPTLHGWCWPDSSSFLCPTELIKFLLVNALNHLALTISVSTATASVVYLLHVPLP